MTKKTKKSVVSKVKKTSAKVKKLTAEQQFEQSETNFWKEVEKQSKYLIANLLERNLPISAIPKIFDLEKDVEYRMILRDYTPQNYADSEEYQEKITNQSWNEEDVEYVAQEVTMWYFRGILKGIATDLSDYWCYENYFFENLTTNDY